MHIIQLCCSCDRAKLCGCPALPLRHRLPIMDCAEAFVDAELNLLLHFDLKILPAVLAGLFAKETSKGTTFLCLLLETERLNKEKLLIIHDKCHSK